MNKSKRSKEGKKCGSNFSQCGIMTLLQTLGVCGEGSRKSRSQRSRTCRTRGIRLKSPGDTLARDLKLIVFRWFFIDGFTLPLECEWHVCVFDVAFLRLLCSSWYARRTGLKELFGNRTKARVAWKFVLYCSHRAPMFRMHIALCVKHV